MGAKSDKLNKMRALLTRAHHCLCDGYVGGEWSALIPEKISMAAAREHDEAVELIAEIRQALGMNAPQKGGK